MKKLLIITLALLMLMLALMACDSPKTPHETTQETTQETTETTLEDCGTGSDQTDSAFQDPSETSEPSESQTLPDDGSTQSPQETPSEEVTEPLETPENGTAFSVTFGQIYTNADKGVLYDGNLSLTNRADTIYLGGVRKNDWMEFQIHTAKSGEYSICMVFGGADSASTYTVYVDGYKATTIKNKISGTDPNVLTDSTDAIIHLTEGVHTVRIVMSSNGPDLYGVKFALIRENLALNKPISADGTKDPQNGAPHANDGDRFTEWSAGSEKEASLIIDLKDLYTLDKIAFLFQNSMCEYSISVSKDGESYDLVCNGAAYPVVSDSAFMREYHLNGARGRYVKITRTLGESTTDQLFSVYEIYLYGEVFVIPPEPVFYDDYIVPHSKWSVSGHCPEVVHREGHGLSGMVSAGGVEVGALLHQGSIGVGKIDLSKYDKVIIYYGLDNSGVTQGYYNANPHNRIMLTKTDTDGSMSPENSAIIASATYELRGWGVTAVEIDLTNIKYNGSVYVSIDTLSGTFMLISDIEFIGGEKK